MMKRTTNIELDSVLEHLACLCPERLALLPLEELEWKLALFVDSWGQEFELELDFCSKHEEKSKLHSFAQAMWPFFISSDFPNVSEKQLRTLALATTCFNLYILYLDDIIDNPETASPEVKVAMPFVLKQWFYVSAILFPMNSLFWKESHRIMLTLSQAMLGEYRHKLPRAMTLDEYLEVARGRVAFTHFNSLGLAILNGSSEHLSELYDCWTGISLAYLIHDDIIDWMEDYENGIYSYLHTQVLFSPPFREEVQAGKLPTTQEVGIALFYSDIAESLYDIAKVEILKAQEIASKNGYCNLLNLTQEAYTLLLKRQTELKKRKLLSLFSYIS